MSYGQMRQNVTMIDELPNLDDIDNYHVRMDQQIVERPDPNEPRFQKHIRGSHRIDNRAGMESYGHPDSASYHASGDAVPQPPPNFPSMEMAPQPNFNCVDIAKHIQSCPLCSKFYNNNDRAIYIIAIVVLCIVCLLLLKRVLNV